MARAPRIWKRLRKADRPSDRASHPGIAADRAQGYRWAAPLGGGLAAVGLVTPGSVGQAGVIVGAMVLIWSAGRQEAFWRGVKWSRDCSERAYLKVQVAGLSDVLAADEDSLIPEEVRPKMQAQLREYQERLAELGDE